jgi:hypothetical protein
MPAANAADCSHTSCAPGPWPDRPGPRTRAAARDDVVRDTGWRARGRPRIMTTAPRASASAMAWPMPLLLPVTRARFPAIQDPRGRPFRQRRPMPLVQMVLEGALDEPAMRGA